MYQNMLQALLFVVTLGTALGFNLTILHTNDVHARYEQTNKYSAACSDEDAHENKCYGGYPRLISKVKDLKTKYPNTLVLDGGDQFQGTAWFYHFGGNVTSYFMNMLGYDAMAIGNHEFDNSVSGLVPFLNQVTFPVLSCNIDASQEPSMAGLFQKSKILTVAGEKIAIIGYTTTDTKIISSTGKLIFKDEIESIRTEVASIKTNDPTINKFIALGHAGFTTDKQIAEKIDEIDIVVGGHSNTFLYSGQRPSNEKPEGEYPFVVNKANGGKALCVQDYAYGKYLGFLNVMFDDDDGQLISWMGNPILLDSTVTPDNDTLIKMVPWKDAIIEFKQTQVGDTKVFLEGDSKVCRLEECNLGNAITDAMLRYNLNAKGSTNWNNVSIVLINSGGIRSPIEQGVVTFEDVLAVSPFRNTVDLLDLKGSDLLEVLEHSVSEIVPGKTDDLAGRFLQFSGLRVKYNVYNPVGQRVVGVKVLCSQCTIPVFEDLDRDTVYTVIIPSFLANGGDAYSVIAERKLNHVEKGDLDSTVFNTYLKQFSPIIQGLDGRIEFVGDESSVTSPRIPSQCATSPSVSISSPSIYLLSILLFLVSGFPK